MRTLKDIRQAGLEALKRDLGVVDTVRFLQQFDMGKGDYTQERSAILGDDDLPTLLAKIKTRRNANLSNE